MRSTLAILFLTAIPSIGWAQSAPVAAASSNGTALTAQSVTHPQTEAEKKGIDYLLKNQKPDGSWVADVGPGVTALAAKALIQGGKSGDDPAVKKALDYIETVRQPNGAYFQTTQPNYNTSCVLSLFAALPEPLHTQYKDRIAKAQDFLKSLQQVEGKMDVSGKPITKDNPWYGGAGYGGGRPDLSNTAFFVESLRDSGVPADDPAIQKAMIFVSHCQMDSETNSLSFAKGATDGGFIYTCIGRGNEDISANAAAIRTYGSMTYAGIKSMIYAGLTKDDPRVQAATKWIKENWTLDENPGLGGPVGLYYYYHTFAKTMYVFGEDTVTDAKGVKHDWRAELVDHLAKLQADDGSWVNKKSDRWLESNPLLVTTYGVLALQEARK